MSRIADNPSIHLDHLHEIKNKKYSKAKEKEEKENCNEIPANGFAHPTDTSSVVKKENLSLNKPSLTEIPEYVHSKKSDKTYSNNLSDNRLKNRPNNLNDILKKHKSAIVEELDDELQEHLDSFHDPIETGNLGASRPDIHAQNIVEEEYEHELHNDDLENIGTDTPIVQHSELSTSKKHEKR